MAAPAENDVAPSLRAELRCDGVSPVATECAMRDPDADRRLPPLVFVDLDQPRDSLDVGSRKTGGDDFVDALVVFHVALQDAVEHFVWRQTVLVFLIRPK